jgi:hypothetical protein
MAPPPKYNKMVWRVSPPIYQINWEADLFPVVKLNPSNTSFGQKIDLNYTGKGLWEDYHTSDIFKSRNRTSRCTPLDTYNNNNNNLSNPADVDIYDDENEDDEKEEDDTSAAKKGTDPTFETYIKLIAKELVTGRLKNTKIPHTVNKPKNKITAPTKKQTKKIIKPSTIGPRNDLVLHRMTRIVAVVVRIAVVTRTLSKSALVAKHLWLNGDEKQSILYSSPNGIVRFGLWQCDSHTDMLLVYAFNFIYSVFINMKPNHEEPQWQNSNIQSIVLNAFGIAVTAKVEEYLLHEDFIACLEAIDCPVVKNFSTPGYKSRTNEILAEWAMENIHGISLSIVQTPETIWLFNHIIKKNGKLPVIVTPHAPPVERGVFESWNRVKMTSLLREFKRRRLAGENTDFLIRPSFWEYI